MPRQDRDAAEAIRDIPFQSSIFIDRIARTVKNMKKVIPYS
jgi:hypothetical protein